MGWVITPKTERSGGRGLLDIQQALHMNYRRNCYHVIVNAIDDSITISEPFTNTFIAEFRHDPTCKRKSGEIARALQNCLHYSFGIGGRVQRYVLSYCFEVVNRS